MSWKLRCPCRPNACIPFLEAYIRAYYRRVYLLPYALRIIQKGLVVMTFL